MQNIFTLDPGVKAEEEADLEKDKCVEKEHVIEMLRESLRDAGSLDESLTRSPPSPRISINDARRVEAGSSQPSCPIRELTPICLLLPSR